MAIEIVSFRIKNVIFHSYVKLPEGISWDFTTDNVHDTLW